MAKRTARRARGDHARRYRRERAVVNRERGFTLMEIVVVLAVFGAFLWIVVVLTADMRAWQKRMPVNFMTHPAITAGGSRLGKKGQGAAPPDYCRAEGKQPMVDKKVIR